GDVRDGDWMNYTHHYPAGTYNVYLRQSQYAIIQSLVTLDLVTSDPTQPNQTTATIGSFIGSVCGIGLFHNVPLTDGTGNPIALSINGTPVSITKTATPAGADVSWCLSVLPPARVMTNTLTYQDNFHTNNLNFTWTYSYPFLAASNSLPLGSRTSRGFSIHT